MPVARQLNNLTHRKEDYASGSPLEKEPDRRVIVYFGPALISV